MISKIELRHFKCFERLQLPLAPLTLLSGPNATGKSSVIQALILLHQTMSMQEWSSRLLLNGPELQLGTVSDVVDQVFGRTSLDIGIEDDDLSVLWTFTGEREEMSMGVQALSVQGQSYKSAGQLRYLLPSDAIMEHQPQKSVRKLRDLTYITAERVGPREFYSLEDRQLAKSVGPRGEHAASILHWGRTEQVEPRLCVADVPPTRLRQVEAHMKLIFPGFSMELLPVANTNAVTLGLRSSEDSGFHRPIHEGFGLTQVLPIVIAALSASDRNILVIENPEVHLHPSGQARMGQFLTTVAAAGIQVILETHSDHVLNGIRRTVKNGIIPSGQVSLHFFRPRAAGTAQIVSPILDPTGNIDTWPLGFFDQFDKDMNYFAGWGE